MVYSDYNDVTTAGAIKKHYGKGAQYVTDDADSGLRYLDSNVMKPIILNFSRFMNGDNVQPYRVYFNIRIIHEITVLKNQKLLRNPRLVKDPMTTAGNNKIQMGRIPMRVYTGQHASIVQDVDHHSYRSNTYMFPIYNPKRILTWYITE